MKRQKKGMSPLIATVLLIGFAVALAALVMTWGLDFIKDQTGRVDASTEEALLCVNQLDFKIEVNCGINATGANIAIDNRGTIDITALRLRKHTTTGAVTPIQLDYSLKSGEKKPYTDLNPLTDATKVDVVATIKGKSGNDILCTSAIREAAVNCVASP